MILDPIYFILVGPFFLLGIFAQAWVRSAFISGQKYHTVLSGYQTARKILDKAGLHHIKIEMISGTLSDHYDPTARVLRLSPDVYNNYDASAVGVAAHEAGHALQHATNYLPLKLRNLIVPAAGFGSNLGLIMFFLGLIISLKPLAVTGLIFFSAAVLFQIINLPVEFNASSRAKTQLANMGAFSQDAQFHVSRVLNAAAMTYIAATLQIVMTLLYYILLIFRGTSQQNGRI
ncbi:MAG: zinc metallopeptidase [Planctomycetia bacterium]|nr:zinc metallopeptidase [Planctomycetia bacterium]